MAAQAGPLGSLVLSVMVIAVFALSWGGVVILRRGGDRLKGVLMLVCAAVVLGNLLILTV